MLLTMHDCVVTQIERETAEDLIRMTWHFPDGIWVAPEISRHKDGKTCRTAEARIVFTTPNRFDSEDDLSVSICMKSRWHGKDKRKLTETWDHMTLPAFIAKMQENGWSLEIVNTYTEGFEFLITGDIHTPAERHWRRFRMSFYAETAHYCWDAIHPDRVW